MNALVTGGAGFIGSNLVDALLARGDRVVIVDALTTGDPRNLAAALETGATLHDLNVVDGDALFALFARERPDVVFHLAAQVDVRRSVADPAADARTNIEGTINVLRAAHESGVRRLVFSSTGGAIYGDAETIPTSEESPALPKSPYGQGKLGAEGYLALFGRLHGLSTIVLRYANVYGPRQNPRGEGGVVAIFCNCVIEGRDPRIFGDGRQTRDFVFVADVVRANLLAADLQLTGIVNIGCGVETSVLDLIDTLRVLRPDMPLAPAHAPARLAEIQRSCLDTRRARDELGWMPSTGLSAGLRQTLARMAS